PARLHHRAQDDLRGSGAPSFHGAIRRAPAGPQKFCLKKEQFCTTRSKSRDCVSCSGYDMLSVNRCKAVSGCMINTDTLTDYIRQDMRDAMVSVKDCTCTMDHRTVRMVSVLLN